MNEPLIVIVEDDASIAELIEYNLQNNSYKTYCFNDGESMLASLPEIPSTRAWQ